MTTPIEKGTLGFFKVKCEHVGAGLDWDSAIGDYYYLLTQPKGLEVKQQLELDPKVKLLMGRSICSGNSSGGFSLNALTQWYLWCWNEYGQTSAQNFLRDFLDADKTPVFAALWILGVEVQTTVSLSDGFKIIPILEMPESRDKAQFLKSRFSDPLRANLIPKCAIVKESETEKLAAEDIGEHLKRNRNFFESDRQLYRIAWMLNALNDVYCFPYYSTSYLAPTTPMGFFSNSGGRWHSHDIVPRNSTALSDRSVTELVELLNYYDNLEEEENQRVERILRRLAQARGAKQIEDKILDLGISLEMMLLDDNDKEQLGLQFRNRGAWLLGENVEDRKHKHDQFKNIYNYRSKVAHSGMLGKDEKEIERVRKEFPRYQYLATSVLRKLLINGRPDWTELTLGGEMHTGDKGRN